MTGSRVFVCYAAVVALAHATSGCLFKVRHVVRASHDQGRVRSPDGLSGGTQSLLVGRRIRVWCRFSILWRSSCIDGFAGSSCGPHAERVRCYLSAGCRLLGVYRLAPPADRPMVVAHCQRQHPHDNAPPPSVLASVVRYRRPTDGRYSPFQRTCLAESFAIWLASAAQVDLPLIRVREALHRLQHVKFQLSGWRGRLHSWPGVILCSWLSIAVKGPHGLLCAMFGGAASHLLLNLVPARLPSLPAYGACT